MLEACYPLGEGALPCVGDSESGLGHSARDSVWPWETTIMIQYLCW
jgi:hypothetical protein